MNDLFNAPSSTPPAPPSGPLEPRKVAAGRGWQWIVEAWRIVRAQWLMWIVLVLAYSLIELLVGLTPWISHLGVVLGPLFLGGLMLASYKATHGHEVELADLFAGFRQAARPLLAMGLILLLVFGAVDLSLHLAGFDPALLEKAADKAPTTLPPAKVWLVVGVELTISLVVAMATWLAPALVVLSGAGPLQALRLSFKAAIRNWLPLTVYGLFMLMLAFLTVLTFGLGMLLWMPVMTLSGFTAWRDIFGPREAPPEQEYLIG